ncbi:MAG: phosphohydrolase [Deltaproteobacteria bacterium]|nr:phosphohydrolase [Deltaproteobacteria bacterium]
MKCPGQDTQHWNADAVYEVPCPKCGHQVEFFKDEPTRKCGNCGHKVVNPKLDFGCAAYCTFAEQCLGQLPPELIAEKEDLLKDRVGIEMRHYFGGDFISSSHGTRAAKYAEKIVTEEKGGNPAVTISAAYLFNIGIKEAEKKHKSTDIKYVKKEGTAVARDILIKLKAKEDFIDEVCEIIGHQYDPNSEESINFKIVYDAEQIVRMEGLKKESELDNDGISKEIERSFLTEGGRKIAKRILLKD